MVIGDAIEGMKARLAKVQAAAKSKEAAAPKSAVQALGKTKIAPVIPKSTPSRPPSTSGKAKSVNLERVLNGGNLDSLANYFATA